MSWCAAEELSAYSVQQGWDPAKVLPCVLDVGAMDFAMPIGKYRGSKRGKLRCKTLDKNGTELDQVSLLVIFLMLPHQCAECCCLYCGVRHCRLCAHSSTRYLLAAPTPNWCMRTLTCSDPQRLCTNLVCSPRRKPAVVAVAAVTQVLISNTVMQLLNALARD